MCLLSRIAAMCTTGCSRRQRLPVNDLDRPDLRPGRPSYLHSPPPPPCAVVRFVLVIGIALGVVGPLRISDMGRRVLLDLDLLRVVVSKRQRCMRRSSGTRAR